MSEVKITLNCSGGNRLDDRRFQPLKDFLDSGFRRNDGYLSCRRLPWLRRNCPDGENIGLTLDCFLLMLSLLSKTVQDYPKNQAVKWPRH